ncbi:serine hydrolase domain-containing protein [Streptomyces sulphureus]|uniref:serine hydrolase domain-containing protein n=1 Tax=Streptomyces sulphureus TaxID=47758 RepID=UPI0003821124|nr:serine hydrolase domain-containing protein [Streptomyces sulphureus]
MQAVAYARLRRASAPERAGLNGTVLAALAEEAEGLAGDWAPGVVVVAGRGQYVALEHAAGWALRYSAWDPEAGRGVELPAGRRLPMRTDTVFDLASLTKLYTAIAVLQQQERGTLDLDAPIAAYLDASTPSPADGSAAACGATLRHLLTHTSGLRPELPLYDLPPQRRRSRVRDEAPLEQPGTAPYRYSDLNLLLAQEVLASVTSRTLDALVADGITRPLGLTDTRFRPPRTLRRRIAATEDQRRPWAKVDRGLLHGVVHDENAHALGGVAGHAGLFAGACDVAVVCRTLLSGGAYGAARILAPSSVAQLLAPPGLGFRIDQPWFMGELAGPLSGGRAAGHTGFTGTSAVLDPETDTFLVVLANTVHPVRRGPDSAPRARLGTLLARAVRS